MTLMMQKLALVTNQHYALHDILVGVRLGFAKSKRVMSYS